jgi:hypothetical protein
VRADADTDADGEHPIQGLLVTGNLPLAEAADALSTARPQGRKFNTNAAEASIA